MLHYVQNLRVGWSLCIVNISKTNMKLFLNCLCFIASTFSSLIFQDTAFASLIAWFRFRGLLSILFNNSRFIYFSSLYLLLSSFLLDSSPFRLLSCRIEFFSAHAYIWFFGFTLFISSLCAELCTWVNIFLSYCWYFFHATAFHTISLSFSIYSARDIWDDAILHFDSYLTFFIVDIAICYTGWLRLAFHANIGKYFISRRDGHYFSHDKTLANVLPAFLWDYHNITLSWVSIASKRCCIESYFLAMPRLPAPLNDDAERMRLDDGHQLLPPTRRDI